jgi:hypothetical protein
MTTDLRTGLERAGRLAPPLEPDPMERLRRRRDRSANRGRAAAATLSLLLVAAAVGGAMLAFRGPGAPAVRHTAAGPAVDLSIPPGAYYYLDQTWFNPPSQQPGVTWTTEYATRTWYRADGSGRIVTDDQGARTDRSYDPGKFQQDTGDLTYLSTDPDRLLAQMTERMQPSGRSPEPFDQFTPGPGQDGHETAGLVRSIGELLNDPNATPALKAALFQVATGLQSMSVTRDATDPVGRPATLLSIETEEVTHEWWFDPASEQLLAMRTSTPGSGDVLGLEIVRASGVAGSTDEGADLIASFVPPPAHDPQKP